MAKRHLKPIFQDLGELIVKWRGIDHASALAVYRTHDKPFSFSYSSYADFERGVALPSLDQALEIAAFFKQSREAMALAWVKAQMPADLKGVFSPHPSSGLDLPIAAPAEHQTVAQHNKNVAPLSLENTWILSPLERDLMLKHPWIIDTFLQLALEYPDSIPPENLGPPEVLEILAPCLQQGRIVKTLSGYKLNDPYFYLPRTKDWQQVRKQNLLRAASQMMETMRPEDLEDKTAYQDVVTRKLTRAEAQALVAHLEKIKDSFFKTSPHGVREVYSFSAVLAPRRFKPQS